MEDKHKKEDKENYKEVERRKSQKEQKANNESNSRSKKRDDTPQLKQLNGGKNYHKSKKGEKYVTDLEGDRGSLMHQLEKNKDNSAESQSSVKDSTPKDRTDQDTT